MARTSPDLASALDTLIYSRMETMLADDYQLSLKGFLAIGSAAVCRIWKDMDMITAVNEFGSYIEMAGIKYPDPAYDWTAGAAREMAEMMTQEI